MGDHDSLFISWKITPWKTYPFTRTAIQGSASPEDIFTVEKELT
jgi:hypothetical protein